MKVTDLVSRIEQWRRPVRTVAETHSPPRILVIADDPGLQYTRALILRSQGYLVECAKSVDEAIAMPGMAQFDLVVIGWDLDGRLRDLYPALAILKIEGGSLPNKYASRTVKADPPLLLAAVRDLVAR